MHPSVPARVAERRDLASRGALVRRIHSEFLEMPGLRINAAQAQRLWGLEPTVCEIILAALQEEGFLKRLEDGTFLRFESR